MNISLEYSGCYPEHKIFLDAMAISMQAVGHRIGIITGERDTDPFSGKNIKEELISRLGFKPDFVYMWGANESISNGDLWKCQRMDQEDVYLHFSSDAHLMKKYTDRFCVKVMDSSNKGKF